MTHLVYASWFGDLGGGELRMLDHIRATAFGAAQTTVLLAQPGPLERELASLGARCLVNPWKGKSSGWAARQWHWYGAWARSAAALRRLRPRLVVCNTYFDLESTGQAAAALRLPLVWRARADTFPYAGAWPAGKLQKVVRFLNERVGVIAATTHYEAQMMMDAGVYAAKVRVIHNGVDLARYGAAAEAGALALRASAGLDSERFVVSFVARMVPQKGYEVFFDALAALRGRGVDAHALVAGDTTLLTGDADAYRQSLRDRVERLGLAACVHFLGFRDDVPAVMAASDAFVCASSAEPFGNTIIEAMAVSRPVVSSDLPGPRESVLPERTGLLFPVGEADALARALERLHADRTWAAALGRAGRNRVEERFDLSTNVRALDEACFEVAARVSRGAAGPAALRG